MSFGSLLRLEAATLFFAKESSALAVLSFGAAKSD
jgi:hypothetical protein